MPDINDITWNILSLINFLPKDIKAERIKAQKVEPAINVIRKNQRFLEFALMPEEIKIPPKLSQKAIAQGLVNDSIVPFTNAV